MSFELFVNGKVKGQIASIGGMRSLEKELTDTPDELKSFLLRGWSEEPETLKIDIEGVLESSTLSNDSRGVLQAILALIPESGIVSISSE